MELILQTNLPPARTVPTEPAWARAAEAAQSLLVQAGRADAEVSVLLTDDPGIHVLNREWRGIDRPTDVLSWPLEEAPALTGEDALGDVAISLDTAARQAAARGWEMEDEVALLLVHGILHLLGYEDDTEEGAEAMRTVETRILGKPLDKVDALSEGCSG